MGIYGQKEQKTQARHQAKQPIWVCIFLLTRRHIDFQSNYRFLTASHFSVHQKVVDHLLKPKPASKQIRQGYTLLAEPHWPIKALFRLAWPGSLAELHDAQHALGGWRLPGLGALDLFGITELSFLRGLSRSLVFTRVLTHSHHISAWGF